MGLDIRWPIGVLFSIYGAVLLAYGAMANRSIFQEKSLGVNIDVWWGLVMLAFGLLMIGLVRGRRTRP